MTDADAVGESYSVSAFWVIVRQINVLRHVGIAKLVKCKPRTTDVINVEEEAPKLVVSEDQHPTSIARNTQAPTFSVVYVPDRPKA